MKMRKFLSVIITLALLASCFASMSIVTVSAHQNYHMNTITFDETNADGTLKFATGNCDVAEGGTYKANFGNVNYGSGLIGAGLSSTKYAYVDVKTAPDARYGKSLYYHEWYESGANQPYIQGAITPNVVNNNANRGLNGTVRITASVYTEKNSSNIYCQRAIKLRTTTTGGYDESYPILFSHEASRLISIFGISSGKAFQPDLWYDVDITYNVDNSQFHAIVYEDGKEYINMTGTSPKALKNIGTMYIYHSPQDSTRNDIKVYWDNVSINSVDKFTISEEDEFPLMDFENLKDQNAGEGFAEGLSSNYSYGFGYQSNPELSVLKALETDKGVSACVYGTPYPGAENTSMTVQRYEYPQLNISGYSLPQFHLKTSVKFQNTKLCGIYLNGQGAAEIMFYDNITAFGQTLFTGYDKTGDVWYDIDLIMDTETGYYDLTIVKTDDNTTKRISGFQTKYQTPITTVKFGHDRGSGTAATFVNESFFWFDNLYLGKYDVDDVGSQYSVDFQDGNLTSNYALTYTDIAVDDISATAGQYGSEEGTAEKTVNATDSFAIPFINDKPYYQITAKFTLEDLNSQKNVYFGNLPILEILTTGQVKCNQSARPKTEGFLIVGNEYTITHVMQAGCTISSTHVSGVMDVNGTIKESSAGYGSGRPSGPYDPFKIAVYPTNDAEKTSTLTLRDIKVDVSYATSTSKDYKIESLVNAAPNGTIFIPHDKRGSGYIYSADVKFNNFDVARSIAFGSNSAFASIDTNGILTMGEATAQLEADKVYRMVIDTNHATSSTATIELAGISATSAATPYINITQDMGANSIMSIDNVSFVAKVPLKVTSAEVSKNVHISDSVTISFTNALADEIGAENFKVYAPTGSITDSALVSDVDVVVSDDKKSVTLTFPKQGATHYHIAFDVTDVFSATLSDWVEVNTAPTPVAGAVAISVENRTATASFVSTGKEGNVFFAVALYADDELISLVPANVTLSKSDIEKEYKVSITAPDDDITYTAKAFRWDALTQNPYEGATMVSQTVAAQ
ncbi:MAG: hypothetical protein II998_05485 [Clostridia bacterium]|nr:hypothetical protein [Clostridia bacterium]